MSKTEITPTAHGEVEYEVVECLSCEQEMAKEEASTEVVLGEVDEVDSWTSWTDIRYDPTYDHRGYLCEFCHDRDGLLGIHLPRNIELHFDSRLSIALLVLTWLIYTVVLTWLIYTVVLYLL